MSKISVVINVTEPEVKFLNECLETVKGWADEIVIIDMECGQSLKKIVKKFQAKVFQHQKVDYVEPVRNFSLKKTKNEWVLILDPDERLTEDLKHKLKKIIEENEVDFVKIPRKNIIFHHWMQHSRWWPDYNIRFFRKQNVKWSDQIHVPPETQGVGIDIPPEEQMAIVHLHYQNISQFLSRLDRYTSQQLNILTKSDYQFRWQDLIVKPVNEFLSRYFAGQGYKDGLHGLALALLQSFSELILYLKVWESDDFPVHETKLVDFSRLMHKQIKDYYWWMSRIYNDTNHQLGSWKYKILNKLS